MPPDIAAELRRLDEAARAAVVARNEAIASARRFGVRLNDIGALLHISGPTAKRWSDPL